MGRKKRMIDKNELKTAYEEVGSIKKLAQIFKTSNNIISNLLDTYKIRKKNIGNKIDIKKSEEKNIINYYVKSKLTLQEISEKYSLKIDKVRSVLRNNGIVCNRWNGHIHKSAVTSCSFLRNLCEILNEKGVEYTVKYKVCLGCVVDVSIGNICFDFLKNKKLVDFNGYSKRLFLKRKKELCLKNGFVFIPVFEDEYKDKTNILMSKILHILKLNSFNGKIAGRKCTIQEICTDDARNFLTENHIQGFVGSTVYLGAIYEGRIVGVMSFLDEGSNNWNLARFASLNGYLFQGIGGKLFSYFIKHYNPIEVRSFADCRWTISEHRNIYTNLGFNFEYTTDPSYMYTSLKSYKRKRREQFKKSNLLKKYDLDERLSEVEIAREIGYGRIWDCGLFKYVWRKEV